jgi:hypothetical protein
MSSGKSLLDRLGLSNIPTSEDYCPSDDYYCYSINFSLSASATRNSSSNRAISSASSLDLASSARRCCSIASSLAASAIFFYLASLRAFEKAIAACFLASSFILCSSRSYS